MLHCTRVTAVGCLQSAALAVSAASAALSCSTATAQHRRWIKMVKAVAAACSHDHLIHVPRTQRNMMGLQLGLDILIWREMFFESFSGLLTIALVLETSL